jgi:hypothetical protein
MGKCKYCGQDAGFFHSKHAECEQRHLSGVARIKSILAGCFQHKEDFYLHQGEIRKLCQESHISDADARSLSLDPYSNGLGVQKDGANDKPMFFENLDSWFCYNAISNLK